MDALVVFSTALWCDLKQATTRLFTLAVVCNFWRRFTLLFTDKFGGMLMSRVETVWLRVSNVGSWAAPCEFLSWGAERLSSRWIFWENLELHLSWKLFLGGCLLGCSAVQAGHPSPWWWRQYRPLKRWYTHTSLHGATTQTTAIFMDTAVRTSSHLKLFVVYSAVIVLFVAWL
jgi:hypothetical protein